MNRKLTSAAALVAGGLAFWLGGPVSAQQEKTGKANWLTDGGDSQRTSWQRNEKLIGKATAKDIELLWTLQTDNQPRQLHNSVRAADRQRRARPRRGLERSRYSPACPTTSTESTWRRARRSGSVISTARSLSRPTAASYGPLCPGGLTATPVVGASTRLANTRSVHISWDGRLRQLDAATGEDLAPAEPFLPPNGKPYALNLVNNVLYTTTAQGCGGNPNQFYGYDLATKKVGSFGPGSGGLWPRLGPSVGRMAPSTRGSGDGDYYPGAADIRSGDYRREAESDDESAGAQGLVRAVQRVLAA